MMRHLLPVIQFFRKKQFSNILIGNQIAEGPKFHHLLQRMMVKYMLKRNQLIASIGSFQLRSPKVCPEGTQIFFTFLSLICIHERINTENFIPISFLLQFLETFSILQNFTKFTKISCFVLGPIFRKLNFDIGIKSGFEQMIFSNNTRKTNQTTQTQKLF